MTYSDFDLEAVHRRLGIMIQPAPMFDHVSAVEVPLWLCQALANGQQLALTSEKARSEFIVAPILLTCRVLSRDRWTIYSGQRLDVDRDLGLIGECDFILSTSPAVPLLQGPLAVVVEAKKNDIEVGLGQCIAQMVGVQRFNQAEGMLLPAVFGCVTTGENWQFLKLVEKTVTLEPRRYFLNELEVILGFFQAILEASRPISSAA